MERISPGRKIKQLRMSAGMTQKQLASLLDKSESAVRMWELERNEPDITALLMLSKIFACSVDFLIGNELSAQEGYLRSGIPYFKEYNTNTNQEQAVGTIYLAKRSVQGSHKYFGLLMPDSSMEPLFRQKELVVIQRQDSCFNGQHAAVLVGNENAVVRRLRFQGDGVLLQPENARHPAVFYSAQDIKNLSVEVLGVAVCSVREVSY